MTFELQLYLSWLVRLKKLEDQVFAEYMPVGTLLSALFAISWI